MKEKENEMTYLLYAIQKKGVDIEDIFENFLTQQEGPVARTEPLEDQKEDDFIENTFGLKKQDLEVFSGQKHSTNKKLKQLYDIISDNEEKSEKCGNASKGKCYTN